MGCRFLPVRYRARMPEVAGSCDDRFVAVRDAFARNFDDRGEVGAAVAVVVDGRPVVDLWGGAADPANGRPWERDTAAVVFSTTKGLTATCALLLWQRGELDIDAPVASVWPEFAAGGKAFVTVRQLLAHQAGLPAFDTPITVEECHESGVAADRLAGQTPRWEPGTAHGYHALSFGWLVGEVVRRVSGRTVGHFFADEVAGPLGLATWIGLPPKLEERVATLVTMSLDEIEISDDIQPIVEAILDSSSDTFAAFTNPPVLAGVDAFNSTALHQAEWPAAGGITTARSLARLYGELACDRVLSASTLDAAEEPQGDGVDRVLRLRTSFGLGYMLPSQFISYGPRGGFGHGGAGGSLAFADRRSRVGFAYVMNEMSASLKTDPRADTLVRAVYASLGEG